MLKLNKKLFSDLTFVILGSFVYIFLVSYLTTVFTLNEKESYILTVFIGAIFMFMSALKIKKCYGLIWKKLI